MAFDHHYRPASQTSEFGLCSSNSFLDGIPFKISTAFKPRAQPSVPPHLLRASQPCDAFNKEYAFDTEEAVLAWSRARQEAKAKAAAEREAAEQRKAALAAAAESKSSDSEEDGGDGGESRKQAEPTVGTSEPQTAKPPWQLPVGGSFSTAILTPTPSQTFQKVQSPLAAPHPVDLALFEQEDDPFDNMELQTLNDMEELRTLLGGAAEGGSQGASPNPDSQIINTGNNAQVVSTVNDGQVINSVTSDSVRQTNAVAENEGKPLVNGKPTKSPSTNIFTSIPGVTMFEKKPSEGAGCPSAQSQCSVKKTSPPPSSQSAVPGTLGHNNPAHYTQQSVHLQTDSAHMNGAYPGSDNVVGSGAELPRPYANQKSFKPALPPIRPRGKSLGGERTVESSGVGSSICAEGQASVPQVHSRHSFMGVGMSQSAHVMSSSSPVPSDALSADVLARNAIPANLSSAGVAASGVFSHNLYSRYGNAECVSPALVNGVKGDRGGLRSAKSNPDLFAPNTSPSDKPLQASAQPWNPFPRLPPTPVQDLWSCSSSPETLPADLAHPNSPPPGLASSTAMWAGSTTPQPAPTPAPTHEPSDYDPYPGLSSQAKTFVSNLTSMGFSRSRVSRAVEKFGTDEREVLDHLLNVDKLVEKKFTSALAERSLRLFRNNISQAELYLGLYKQFTELGFSADRIQTALVKHQLDRDRALDDLTS
ncbi:hypothetical protein ACOMHN_022769 [Nucella lapillus]